MQLPPTAAAVPHILKTDYDLSSAFLFPSSTDLYSKPWSAGFFSRHPHATATFHPRATAAFPKKLLPICIVCILVGLLVSAPGPVRAQLDDDIRKDTALGLALQFWPNMLRPFIVEGIDLIQIVPRAVTGLVVDSTVNLAELVTYDVVAFWDFFFEYILGVFFNPGSRLWNMVRYQFQAARRGARLRGRGLLAWEGDFDNTATALIMDYANASYVTTSAGFLNISDGAIAMRNLTY